ncbi:MAG TPA: TraR/DksA C4-type zinc finger protein [Candidatus Binataceae bacterium]|jgi:DnaK suppressor protein|nr:TraR/DksA C4-type zinc finger protein [Candidatus Binataceae bacterium]
MKHAQEERFEGLRQLLLRQREETLNRVRAIGDAQSNEGLSTLGDEMDVARSLADVETHASLIENAENKVRRIDSALAQLEQGDYGICANCGEEIPLARLEAVPFAIYCVDCQAEFGERASGVRENTRAAYKQWMPVPDTDETRVVADDSGAAVDEVEIIPRAVLESDDDEDNIIADDIEPEPAEEAPPIEGKTKRRRSRAAKNQA